MRTRRSPIGVAIISTFIAGCGLGDGSHSGPDSAANLAAAEGGPSSNVLSPDAKASSGSVWRFAKISNGAYFYTGNGLERDVIRAAYPDFRYENEAFGSSTGPGSVPVYRFANTNTGGYFFTASEAERDFVRVNPAFSHMRYEGSTFSVASATMTGALPVYRLANLNNGGYLYTQSELERAIAKALGFWRDEGVAFHAVPANMVDPVTSPAPAPVPAPAPSPGPAPAPAPVSNQVPSAEVKRIIFQVFQRHVSFMPGGATKPEDISDNWVAFVRRNGYALDQSRWASEYDDLKQFIIDDSRQYDPNLPRTGLPWPRPDVDTTPPGTPTVSSESRFRSARPVFDGTGEANVQVAITIWYQNSVLAEYYVKSGSDGRWRLDTATARTTSGAVHPSDFVSGTYLLQALAKDAAGNASGVLSRMFEVALPPQTKNGCRAPDVAGAQTYYYSYSYGGGYLESICKDVFLDKDFTFEPSEIAAIKRAIAAAAQKVIGFFDEELADPPRLILCYQQRCRDAWFGYYHGTKTMAANQYPYGNTSWHQLREKIHSLVNVPKLSNGRPDIASLETELVRTLAWQEMLYRAGDQYDSVHTWFYAGLSMVASGASECQPPFMPATSNLNASNLIYSWNWYNSTETASDKGLGLRCHAYEEVRRWVAANNVDRAKQVLRDVRNRQPFSTVYGSMTTQ